MWLWLGISGGRGRVSESCLGLEDLLPRWRTHLAVGTAPRFLVPTGMLACPHCVVTGSLGAHDQEEALCLLGPSVRSH